MKQSNTDVELADKIHQAYQMIRRALSKVIVGQDEVLEQLLTALLARGHCLLVGVPGLAKTLIIRTLGQIIDLHFSRIQFTPDLMPSDITGTEILEEDRSSGHKIFKFVRGPVFANLVLADEINRTPPKTQSALLEAMQEYKVTAAGQSYELEKPFFVLATQNPIEQEGTYPLPEAQLDRFMFSLWLDYPEASQEMEIVKRTTVEEEVQAKKIIKKEQIIEFQNLIRKVPVSDHLVEYAVKLVSSTRPGSKEADPKIAQWVRWGAGPRASQYLILGAKVRAVLNKRYTPQIEDVKAMALPVLRHRILPSYSVEAEGMKVDDIINFILEQVSERQS